MGLEGAAIFSCYFNKCYLQNPLIARLCSKFLKGFITYLMILPCFKHFAVVAREILALFWLALIHILYHSVVARLCIFGLDGLNTSTFITHQ